ncbi:MAG: hypothetical protein ACPGQQ_03945 [Candidatus Puniceispirillaceae bacterium]
MGYSPRKPRAKSPSKKGQGKHPQKAPKNNYFATLMQTEEGRALRRKWSTKPKKNAGRPRGVPDGYTRERIEPVRAAIKEEAKRIVNKMSQDYNIEDKYAKTALETAVEVMRCPGDNRERVAAARLVLDFTKSKPVSKNELAISKAEDFLAGLLADEDNGQETQSGS